MADFVPAHISVSNYNTVVNEVDTLLDNVDSLMGDVALEFVIDGGGAAITTGEKGHIMLPFNGTTTLIYLLADQVGSIEVDLWRDYWQNFPPTVDDSITNGHVPAIVNDRIYWYSTGGWGSGREMNKYDVIAFNVNSCDTITRLTIYLMITKSLTPTRPLYE